MAELRYVLFDEYAFFRDDRQRYVTWCCLVIEVNKSWK